LVGRVDFTKKKKPTLVVAKLKWRLRRFVRKMDAAVWIDTRLPGVLN